ncbi:MAG: PAS domain S-box protein [Syntrophus sp. (in: bacteria)]
MKRTIIQGLGLRSLFPATPVPLSFAKMRLVILSVSLISMVLIWPAGLSQARDMATVQHSNPTSLPSKSLKTIIVSDYYPYTFVNDKGVPDGFSVDVAKAIASSMDLNLDIRVDTWEHATRALSDGTIDLLPMMAYSPERDKAFDFSAPHTIAYDAVFSRRGAKRVGSLKDLTDKTVIVMNKDAAHQYLLNSGMASKTKLILVDSLPDALRTLATGKGDAALMPKLVGMILMKKLNLTNLDPSPVVIDAYNRPFSFAVKEGNQTMLERLSQGLSIIKSTGQYKDIYNKWFGALEPPALSWKTVIKYIAIIVAVFLVIALGLTVWTIFLRRQVALQTRHLVEEIQERKRTEEALTKSEAKYSSYVGNAPDGVFIADEKGRYVEVNNAACLMTGFTEEELLQMSIPDLLSEESLEAGLAHFKALTETGVSKGELQYKRKDGSKRWWFVDTVKLSEARFLGFTKDVTERKHVEMGLLQLTERFNIALYASKAGAWDWDIISGQVEWSSQMFDLFGVDPLRNKASFDTWKRALHPQDAEIAGIWIDQALQQQAILNSDYRVLLPDGQISWINAVGQGEYDEQGNPIRMTGICMDITERKQAEEKLRESETRFRTLSRVAPVGVYMTDEKGRCRYVNERWMEMAGITFEEALGDGWIKGIHPQDRDLIASSWHKMLESKGNWGLEYRFQTRDGIVTWVKGLATDFFDSTGQVMGYIGANMDITDRKEAEDALRESENRYRTVVSSADDGIILQENTGIILTWNKAAEKIFGISADEVLGQTSTSRDWKTYREDGSEVPGAEHPSMHTLATGEPCNNILMKVVRSTGDHSWINVNTSPIYKERDSKPRAVVIRISDITERRQAEEKHRNLEERLRRAEKMEALGTLAGGVAHDLNNVLGIVVGYAEMLMDEIGESSPLREDVMKIMEGGNRSAAIVQDLLTLARRGVQSQKVVNLNATIKDYQKTPEFESLLSLHRRVHIKTNLETDLLNIIGSPVHLGKTIINLVANAMEAITDGGAVIISTSNQSLDKPVHGYDTVNEGDYVVLSITDTGEGISENDIKHIFEPFYTKKAMGRSGTGLGLAVVWGTVKDHNGYINVESEVGKGTTFTLYFPVTREDIAVVPMAIPMSDYIGNDESILVIDDIKEQRELASKMLGKLNYKVKSVSSGEEALEYLRNEKVDLIVLDMIMDPGMDGLDTYKAIAEIYPKQKAVIVSGFSETDRVKEAKMLGVGDYIRKPYVIERLGLAVRKELDRQ